MPAAMPSKIEDLVDEPPTSINPYRVLELDKDATADQVKAAYRKAALKHHPDKAAEADKPTAHTKFQEVAFAYAILSDPRRRSRYDVTGRTSETLSLDDDDDFNWSDFFRSQFADIVSTDAIERFKKEYQGGEEEKLAVIEAYVNGEGDMDAVFEHVMLSNPLDDEERFRKIIDDEIDEKRVEAYDKYVKETKTSRKRRAANAKKEAAEAVEMARELGVEKKLFGNGTPKKRKANDAEEEPDYSELATLIQQRQKDRAGNFLADLEAKYAAPKKGGKKGKRPAADEPPEEAFQKTAEKGRKSNAKATGESTGPRKSKRAKR